MVPQINVSTSVFEQLKDLAEPFIDTPETVINRLIEHYHKTRDQSKPSKPTGSDNNGLMHFPIDSPPQLKFTRVMSIALDGAPLGKQLLYWNALLFEVVQRASKKLTPEKLRQALLVNYVDGEKSDSGYRYIPEAGLSVQGQDSNYAWKATAGLLKAAGMTIDIVFQWEPKDQAAYPGKTAHMT
jgi:hypothetical protein